ncbi:hypothetical protein ACUXCC_002632 [Cytobacillus horneckiae]|uniref:hypothetical protein n=1 Tax=Cytobacillus horneckiae TaxID=549687 RepID=UPI0019D08EE8|nr:hypothetical protein [Cytobacillus horneckiae]MBN6887477.1 hypothetical protein [Cytobacillus horneckiae]
MKDFPGFYATQRRYMKYKGDEFLMDVISVEGFRVFLTQISTGRIEEGFHRTNEADAIMNAVEKF